MIDGEARCQRIRRLGDDRDRHDIADERTEQRRRSREGPTGRRRHVVLVPAEEVENGLDQTSVADQFSHPLTIAARAALAKASNRAVACAMSLQGGLDRWRCWVNRRCGGATRSPIADESFIEPEPWGPRGWVPSGHGTGRSISSPTHPGSRTSSERCRSHNRTAAGRSWPWAKIGRGSPRASQSRNQHRLSFTAHLTKTVPPPVRRALIRSFMRTFVRWLGPGFR